MDLSIENLINRKFVNIFNKIGLDAQKASVKVSDRPDLSDFQCNGALALAKSLKKNPRDIAAQIVVELEKDPDFAKISIDGPGFINVSLKDEFIARATDKMAEEKDFGIAKVAQPHTVVLDFGGPNVAKEMHVGHLRSGAIGESIQRIERFVGNKVISDVHFGDWGTPMGMIIAEIERMAPQLPYFDEEARKGYPENPPYTVEEVSAIYKQANARCKEDETARERARIITARLQDGHPGYRALWKHLRDVSVAAVKANYNELDVHFDLWLGESDAHETCKKIVALAKDKKLLEHDEGANIIRLEEGNKPMPPVILEKSDGGFTYHTTDIATIKMRVDELKANEIIYVVDKRQSLHFEQVFAGAEKLGIAPGVTLKHIGFGTVNGADGKPFKTRDGGVMTLSNMIRLSKDKVAESMPKPGEVPGYGAAELEKLISDVAVAAIKFQDLKNTIGAGYVFDLEDFAKFDGKTGPYIQYAIARINSILRKAAETGIEAGEIVISNREERDLALKLAQLSPTVWRAHSEKEPSILSEYAYTLAQAFSSFYGASSIMNAPTPALASSRLKLARLVRDILTLLLYLLGIRAPEVMLKAGGNA